MESICHTARRGGQSPVPLKASHSAVREGESFRKGGLGLSPTTTTATRWRQATPVQKTRGICMKVGPGNNTEEVDSPLGMDVHEVHLHSTKRSNTEGPLDVAHIRNTARTLALSKPRQAYDPQ